MSHRIMMAILLLIAAVNIMALSINLSQRSSAATRAPSYQQLMSDPDFIRAVKSIAEACSVNVDMAKLKC
jgi:hypothetical protein